VAPAFALAGIVDIVAEHDLLGSQAFREANNFFATGNHYVLDVVGSALLLFASIAVARVWGRLVEGAGHTSNNR
jgi:hypothetical protein